MPLFIHVFLSLEMGTVLCVPHALRILLEVACLLCWLPRAPRCRQSVCRALLLCVAISQPAGNSEHAVNGPTFKCNTQRMFFHFYRCLITVFAVSWQALLLS